MRLISWNVNGIRAASKSATWKDLWNGGLDADIVALQEVKAFPEQLEFWLREPSGYSSHWHCAEKAGYSGTAVFSKREPRDVKCGIGVPEIDREGRVLVVEYDEFTLINSYFPNSQRDHARLGFKLEFCAEMLKYCEKIRAAGKHLVLCGDFNIAHRAIDLRNPKANEKNAGYLPEERGWMEHFLNTGYVDAFRNFVQDPLHYTWWSYRPGVRERNIGWRLDYHVTNQEFRDRLDDAKHLYHIVGSDHCPVLLDVKD